MIDSGAAVNIISEEVFNTLKPKLRLSTAKIKIFSYGSKNALPIISTFTCNVQATHKYTKTMFYVLKGDGHSLLSYATASELGLIQIIT